MTLRAGGVGQQPDLIQQAQPRGGRAGEEEVPHRARVRPSGKRFGVLGRRVLAAGQLQHLRGTPGQRNEHLAGQAHNLPVAGTGLAGGAAVQDVRRTAVELAPRVASLISRNSVCRRSSEAVGDHEAPKCRAEMTAVRWWGLRNIHVRGACPGRMSVVTPFDAVACRGRQGGVARAGAGVCRPSAGRTGGSRRAGGGMRPWRPPGTLARRRCWPGAGG